MCDEEKQNSEYSSQETDMKKQVIILCVLVVVGLICISCKKSKKENAVAEGTETATAKSEENKIVDTNTEQEQAMLIHPGVGVGEICLGMKVDEMKNILGEPDYIEGNGYVYSSLGVTVFSADKVKIEFIHCGSIDENSPLVKMCKYRTKEGIGMG